MNMGCVWSLFFLSSQARSLLANSNDTQLAPISNPPSIYQPTTTKCCLVSWSILDLVPLPTRFLLTRLTTFTTVSLPACFAVSAFG